MTGSAVPDAADALYAPLAAPAAWARSGAERVISPVVDDDDPAWVGMTARGALLAAAHESGALDGLYPGDAALATALLGGTASLAAIEPPARAHVAALHEALEMAAGATADDLSSPAWIRRLHHVACRPQLTHAVHGDHGPEAHVLATGDYKHHPNHERDATGAVVPHAPVGLLHEEMQRFARFAGSEHFASLDPIGRAAYAHHAITHVAPFADGNGRVARILASAHLLRAASIPFLVFERDAPSYAAACQGPPPALPGFVTGRAAALVVLLGELRATARTSPDQAAALGRWEQRSAAAGVLASNLPAAVEAALHRHRRRPDLGFLSDLSDATAGPSPVGVTIVVRGIDVDETVRVDAHPLLDDGTIVLRAEHAQLRLALQPGELVPAMDPAASARLDTWLDRAMSTFALRVAAALE